MKRYIATWFNYIAQGETTIKILAESEEEAEELAVKFMLSEHPSMHYDKNNISTLTELEDIDIFYTKEEIDELYDKSMKRHQKWLDEKAKKDQV